MNERKQGARAPDYELEALVEVSTPQQLKAIGDDTRQLILSMLNERAATVSQLAEALSRPKGSVGHHVKVLHDAGLVRVVRTRQVRAMTEKYYGRTARTFWIRGLPEEQKPFFMLEEAMRECRVDPAGDLPVFTIRRARIPRQQARGFVDRVVGLAEEFAAQEPGGDTVFGFVAGVYPTDRPWLEEEEEEDGGEE